MKRFSALIVALLLIFCTSCSKSEPEVLKTPDMLNITNDDADFLGCRERFEAVMSAVSSKITVLENAHNDKIRIETESEYFFEDEYILTSFEPFILSSFSLSEHFTSSMTQKQAEENYKTVCKGMTVEYSSDNDNHTLRFVSEELVEEYTAEYNEEFDSFRYSFTVENADGRHTEEFLEFTKYENGVYAIQSKTSRCYVDFDENDEIESIYCTTLKTDEYSLEADSIYPTKELLTSDWVNEKGRDSFISIHSFNDGILTHSECSSGPWKTVKITASDYSSAFYM